MKVIWTEQAYECLKEIYNYISKSGNSLSATRLIESLIEKGDSLLELYNRGRIVPELGLEDIREFIEGNYRIVYRVRINEIQILSVFEAHQLLKESHLT